MNIEVTRDNVTILEQSETPHENEYKITTCYFTFDDFTSSFQVKRAIFTILSTEEMYETDIINNQCDIPSEVLKHEYETVKLGVYGYNIGDNNELLNRFSPSYAEIIVPTGSYKEGALSPEPITPSQYDLYSQTLQEGLQEVDDKLDEVVETVDSKLEEVDGKIEEVDEKIDIIDDKIAEVDTAITETNNLNLDVSDKVDGDVTVTLTKKDASTKSVIISDGTSLMFNWDGTKLGVKTDEDSEYVYVDLQGIQGVPGPQGEPFRIKKTYSSVVEMNADFNNMQYGDYVMIASTVEIEDNAKLYTRGEYQWIFITDFSGAQGIKGETGATPNIQIGTVTSGSTPSVTRTGTNENPVLNFVLQPGEKGNKGDTGATGNGIASITKTSTSGLVDTYTITYTSGNTTTFNVTNGNGIDHISLTSQSGATKVYTIYFTDGNTTTFTVEDGEVTQEVFDEEVERLKMVYNAMPKVSGEGTDLTLDNTAECPVYDIELKPSELEQETTSISEGDEYDSPSPEHPQDIHTVSGENSVKIQNKNLLNRQTCIENGILKWADGETITTSTYAGGLVSDYIRTKSAEKYILNYKCSIFFYDKNKTYLGALQNNGITIDKVSGGVKNTFTVPNIDEIYYMRLSFRATNDIPDFTILNIMVNKGDTLLSYVPHQEQTYPLSLGDLEYCKIGDYEDLFFKNVVGSQYYDSTLELDKWYLKKNIEKNTLTSFSGSVSSNVAYFGLSSRARTISNSQVIYCDKLNFGGNYTSLDNAIAGMSANQISANNNGSSINVFMKIPNCTSIAEYNNYISNNNLTIYYQLATPTNTLVNDTLQTQLDNLSKAISYQEETNVNQENNDLPFVIKISAIRDMSNIFDLITG